MIGFTITLFSETFSFPLRTATGWASSKKTVKRSNLPVIKAYNRCAEQLIYRTFKTTF